MFFRIGFRDPDNKVVTKMLVEQVQCVYPEFQASQIRGKLVLLNRVFFVVLIFVLSLSW